MGADVQIYVQVKSGLFPKADLSGLDVSSVYERGDDSFEGPPNSRWCVACWDRYYGPGYARGHWPRIRETLERLRAAPNVVAVWYNSGYSDGEGAPLVTDALLAEIDALWAESKNETYERAFR